jgi:hypothetical protein
MRSIPPSGRIVSTKTRHLACVISPPPLFQKLAVTDGGPNPQLCSTPRAYVMHLTAAPLSAAGREVLVTLNHRQLGNTKSVGIFSKTAGVRVDANGNNRVNS